MLLTLVARKGVIAACAGEWDPYWHMLEELQERADKGTKAAVRSAAKKPATANKTARRYCSAQPKLRTLEKVIY